MQSAQAFGAILADREADILEALTVFGQLQSTLRDNVLYSTFRGAKTQKLPDRIDFMSLGGKEISPRNGVSPFKIQNIHTTHLLDQSA